jgi:hypothetical protein
LQTSAVLALCKLMCVSSAFWYFPPPPSPFPFNLSFFFSPFLSLSLSLSPSLPLSLPLPSPLHSDKNLQLVFTILQASPDSALRSNIVIALGDLAFRFPNTVEPWTSHMYDRLKDADSRVRKNTLMVLTHLILNDMIRYV